MTNITLEKEALSTYDVFTFIAFKHYNVIDYNKMMELSTITARTSLAERQNRRDVAQRYKSQTQEL